ncbi:hypothetical protein [Streptomyces halobius]|uniref:Uncharacterized protein n=1 Tax=Streptomyces halobius TaxID=2879846 RepID=A0ABY4M864_9ACTN|nr:hypothetical protein [Streptomyces halobius]UQA93927.1 hypothetical protein K9S39_20455 [Streptomyces halobius]
MNASQQHMLDAYRAAQHGETAPVLPGAATVQTAREIREWRRFRAVVTAPANRFPGRTGRAVRRMTAALGRVPEAHGRCR